MADMDVSCFVAPYTIQTNVFSLANAIPLYPNTFTTTCYANMQS